jgi:uncharacterized protein
VRRREFAKLLASAAVSPALFSRSWSSAATITADAKVTFRLQPFNYHGVRLLDGMLKRQLDATRDTYFRIPNDSLLLGFRRRAGLPTPGEELGGWYGSDTFNVFPQMLSGMARMARATGDAELHDKTVFLMHEWAKTIEPDGYFFYSRKPHLPHYIYDKHVGWLNDMYELHGDRDALVYIDRITDWAIENLDRTRLNSTPTEFANEEWYTLSENLYRAYLLTGETKYRAFAEVWHYDRYWNGMAEGHPEVADHLHAYSHVNTLSSAAMAYIVTGNGQFLRAITHAYDYFQSTQCYSTGGYGPSERLATPDGALGMALDDDANTFETPCGTWAGFKLSRYLMSLTGEARYGDWIERLTYNGIGASLPMTEKGETFYYADYRVERGTKKYIGIQWPCCSGTYPQDVADYHNLIYFKSPDGLYVNLFVPSEVVWHHRDQDVTLRQETSYPESESVILTVNLQSPLDFSLHFRVPGWAKDGISVKTNGSRENVESRPNKWMKVTRTWRAGDRVELRIPLQLRFEPVDVQHPKRVAVVCGPSVLVRRNPKTRFADFSAWQATQDAVTFSTTVSPAAQFVPFYRIGHCEPYSMYFDL